MISVIIPTVNESEHLPQALRMLRENPAPHETTVSDGGSSDGTLGIAAQYGARVLRAPRPGRAAQMNAGAQLARGEVLLFLHADTQVRPSSLEQIEHALQRPAVVGGGFERRFDSASLFLRFTCWLATWRCRALGWFLGDQGIFVRRSIFDQLRGFKEMPVFEDLDFARRLARAGKVVTISPGVISSPRRFARRGIVLTTCSDFWLTCRYLAGLKARESTDGY